MIYLRYEWFHHIAAIFLASHRVYKQRMPWKDKFDQTAHVGSNDCRWMRESLFSILMQRAAYLPFLFLARLAQRINLRDAFDNTYSFDVKLHMMDDASASRDSSIGQWEAISAISYLRHSGISGVPVAALITIPDHTGQKSRQLGVDRLHIGGWVAAN